MKAIDWFGRVLLLVLSGTATLSLIGAIVETTNTVSMPPRPVVERVEAPVPGDEVVVREPIPAGRAIEAGLAPMDREAVRWLRALTYAVTALAGFAAAALIVLLRMTATLDRIASR